MILFSFFIVIVQKNVEKHLELMIQLNVMIIHLYMNDHIQLVRIECLLKVKINFYLSIFFSLIKSIDPSLSSDSIGSKLMKKHGWQEGQGLGKKLQGRADPLQVSLFKN